jgi:hypothetical protein
MDTTVWIAIIVAVSTLIASLGATWLNNLSSNKRFKIELGRAIDVDRRTRKWQVNSKPLLELRGELSVMASKLDRLVKAAFSSPDIASELYKKEFEQAHKDWSLYLASDKLSLALFSIDDKEIIDLVTTARNEYLDAFDMLTYDRAHLSAVEVGKAARAPEEKIRWKIIDIQALINKRLEEL